MSASRLPRSRSLDHWKAAPRLDPLYYILKVPPSLIRSDGVWSTKARLTDHGSILHRGSAPRIPCEPVLSSGRMHRIFEILATKDCSDRGWFMERTILENRIFSIRQLAFHSERKAYGTYDRSGVISDPTSQTQVGTQDALSSATSRRLRDTQYGPH